MSNTITAYFKGRAGVAESVYQYDYGKILIIDGLDLPATFETHFANSGDDNAITVIGQNNRVAIPNACLTATGIVTAYIYLHSGDNDGETEYVVRFAVIQRARPAYDSTEEERNQWETAASMALAMLQNSRKVNTPLDAYQQVTNGTAGQLLRTKGNGATEWVDEGLPTDEQTAQAVSDWLDDHPEATTTVEDNSLTYKKLVLGTLGFVTPQMFGAKGDGVTNDTASIKSAIDYASANGLKCFIPSGTYIISPDNNVTAFSESINYCFEINSNTYIEGAGEYSTILKVVTDKHKYLAVFLNYDLNTTYSDICLKNFTVEQDPTSVSDDMTAGTRANGRAVIAWYSPCKNIVIDHIFFKNCCGGNPLHINNYATTDVMVNACTFSYKHMTGISYYDRSCVYLECSNYVIQNCFVYGNLETNGGIELHGYNGTAFNNYLDNCHTAIHVAARFAPPIEKANIFIKNNKIKDCVFGIKLWDNTHSGATKGLEGLIIDGNIIDTDGAVSENIYWRYDGSVSPQIIGGITAETYMETTYKDIKIINNSVVIHNALDYETVLPEYSYGIGIINVSNMEDILIAHNYVDGTFGNGIVFGNPVATEAYIRDIKNFKVINNTLVNCGRNPSHQNAFYQAYIFPRHGNKTNVFINDNILNKTDEDYTVASAIYNLATATSTHKSFYCQRNEINRISASEMAISFYTEPNMIVDRGIPTVRPTSANIGDQFYDVDYHRLQIWSGAAWLNPDGTAIS